MMHQAAAGAGATPYGSGGAWPAAEKSGEGEIRRAVEENPVVVVGRSGCCMVHVVRRLLQGQGVNPLVCEVGDDSAALLAAMPEVEAMLPMVFVGGRLVGGLDRLMAVHIAGELVPILKQAGALWL